jgi:hypothetical protein
LDQAVAEKLHSPPIYLQIRSLLIWSVPLRRFLIFLCFNIPLF